jgi:hypothetical protein
MIHPIIFELSSKFREDRISKESMLKVKAEYYINTV